ncbi:MAG: hypothetical protein JWR00_1707 [Rubritepida sp.]|jgi:uncharacterized small protein (DUF1192 family)|nr:hypothetical protein [Rubritepida sp.]
MFDEEPRPKPVQRFVPAALQDWAETELRAYIADLQAEIARAEAAIASRSHQRSAADAFFRKPG